MRHLASLAFCVILFLGVSASFAAAQGTAGNLIALTHSTVWEIDGSGTVQTSIALPPGHRGLGLCPTVDNRGIVVASHFPRPTSNDWYLHVWTAGRLTTLTTVLRPGGVGLQPPQQGLIPTRDAQYLATVPWSVGGTVLVDEATGLVATLDVGAVTAVAPDDAAGGWLLFGGGGVDHLSEAGARTNLAIVPGQATFGIGALFTRPASATPFIAYRGLLEFSRTGANFTTLIDAATRPSILSGHYERTSGTLFLADSTAIIRTDVRGNVLGTLAQLPSTVLALTQFGANNIQSRSLARRSAPLLLSISFPNHAGRPYRVGASFGFAPGIPTPAGVLPLSVDPLLFASQTAPSTFVGFRGVLDTLGRAAPVVNVPNVPSGLRVYFAAMVTDAAGVALEVSETLGVTIR